MVALFALVALPGCSRALTEDDLVEAYQLSYPAASDETAGCVVGELVDAYEIVGVETELAAVSSSAAFAEAQYLAQFHCGQTDDVLRQVIAMLVERDLDPDQANCVATALVGDLDDQDLEVLMRGEMTDQFFDKYFTATYDCDALPD